jgi:hypothetical protein
LVRFLEVSAEKETEEGVQLFLSGFFREMRAHSISYRSSGNMTAEEATIALSKRLVAKPIIMDGGTGLGFEMVTTHKDKWCVVLHRDVFFRAELRAFVGDTSKVTRQQGRQLVNTGTAHLFTNTWGVRGSPVDIYLSLKQHDLRTRHARPLMPEGGLAASAQFREICRRLWSEAHPRDSSPRFLSAWGWKISRFVRSYDRLLAGSVASEQLGGALEKMGMSMNLWLGSL